MASYNLGFKRIEILFWENVLGTGAYGQVYKAKCDDLVCAAKILHLVLTEHDQSPLPNEATVRLYNCKSCTRN